MKLVALHGATLNGQVMRAQLDFVQHALPSVEIVAPDAPHVCSEEAVDRAYEMWQAPRRPSPHCIWWDASDDGREYRGWEQTRELLRAVIPAAPVGLVGFSQGAILAAAIAAMAAQGEMPPVDFVVLIAGRAPRSDALTPFLDRPMALPSLHVWGARDSLIGESSAALVERFDPDTREIAVWPGSHTVPETGPAAAAIVDFVGRFLPQSSVSRTKFKP
jgi:pimeloyl-ACP methyl ester carboxylesterase